MTSNSSQGNNDTPNLLEHNAPNTEGTQVSIEGAQVSTEGAQVSTQGTQGIQVQEDATPSSSPNNSRNIDENEMPSYRGETGNLRSVVWNHFKKRKVEGIDKAECNYCSKLLVGESRKGTKHLHDHFKRCPRRKFTDIRDMRQKILVNEQNKVDGKLKLGAYNFDQDVSRKELASMIILHEYPLSMVDHLGFRRFATSLQPLFKMVSRNTIKNDILKVYDFEKHKVLGMLDKNKSRIAITTDMWTSSNRRRGFMVVTTHFIDEFWILHNRVMRFIYVPSPHTKEVLSDVLLDCLLEWNIDRKLSTMTVDNCSTNDAMVRILLEKLQPNSLMLQGSLFHMRCAAHILNLIVQDGLAVIGKCIENVRDSVVFWTASTKRRQKFQETARQLHVRCSKELVLDCKTRWNSTFFMLSTALVYKDVFFRLKQRDSSYNCMPSEEEWVLAEDICEKLELFHAVTELFSGTSYPTANLYFPKVCEVKIALADWYVSSSDVLKDMAYKMFEKFDSYWKVIHGIMGVAAVLDPRYKMMLLEFYFPTIYGDDSDDEVQKIRDICYKLLQEYSSQIVENEASCDISSTSENTQNVVKNKKDSLSSYDQFVSLRKKGGHGNTKLELDHYIEDDVLPRSQDFDILTWWKSNGPKYPTLQRIARDVLAVPISTVASESAFSTSGRLLSPHRSKLHANTLEALMCAQNWLWSELKGFSSTSNGQECGTIQTILDDYDDDESCVMMNGESCE